MHKKRWFWNFAILIIHVLIWIIEIFEFCLSLLLEVFIFEIWDIIVWKWFLFVNILILLYIHIKFIFKLITLVFFKHIFKNRYTSQSVYCITWNTSITLNIVSKNFCPCFFKKGCPHCSYWWWLAKIKFLSIIFAIIK